MLDLIDEFIAIIPLTDEAKMLILRHLKERHFSKNHYLLEAGQVCRQLYFIKSGTVYGYFRYRGEPRSMRFSKEKDICFVPESFLQQIPSKEALQALSETFVYSLSYDAIQEISRTFPKMRDILQHYFLKDYAEANSCLYMFRSLDGRHRYKWMAEHDPTLVNTFPLSKTSSYIGLSPTSVGRFIRQETGRSVIQFKKQSKN